MHRAAACNGLVACESRPPCCFGPEQTQSNKRPGLAPILTVLLLALKNQPQGRCPGAAELVWEVCTVSQDLKIRAVSRRTATGRPTLACFKRQPLGARGVSRGSPRRW